MQMMPAFRVRSRERDYVGDLRRLHKVHQAIQCAIADIDAEVVGLRRRIRQSADGAAFLFGPELESATRGSAEAEIRLRHEEVAIVGAERRLRDLERQLQGLREAERHLLSVGPDRAS
jgi:hypothetical protein